MPAEIYALVKLLDKMEYAESFRQGHLRMCTLRSYKHYKDVSGELRGDEFEGVVSILQPSKIGEIQFGGNLIKGEDLATPIVICSNELLNKHAFCLYSLNSRGFDSITKDTFDEFRNSLELHHECFGLGKYCVVIINVTEFIERCKRAINKMNIKGKLGLVDYFDDSIIHGALEKEKHGFQKRIKYAHQREYRILIENNISMDCYSFNIGDISDISITSNTEEFNKQLKISLPKD